MTIDQIIVELEKATGPDRITDFAIWRVTHGFDFDVRPVKTFPRYYPDGQVTGIEWPDGRTDEIGYVPSYTSSIDAALTLIDQNEMTWWVQTYKGAKADATVMYGIGKGSRPDAPTDSDSGAHDIPAIALVIAALKARKASL